MVSQENYDNDLAVVNGHAYKGAELKSPNTNLAILCSHNFSVPFNQPIAYAQKVGELTNMLANGHHPGAALRRHTGRQAHLGEGARPLQRQTHAGGRRGGRHHRRHALPGDDKTSSTSSSPWTRWCPAFASYETLLYSPELKFYSNKVKMDTHFNTNIVGLHALGDASGWTRGLMMASAMGVLMGRELA